MLRCAHCGGYAMAGLAHLHGLPDHLCASCARDVMDAREQARLAQRKPRVIRRRRLVEAA